MIHRNIRNGNSEDTVEGTRIVRIYSTWSLFKIAANALVITSNLNGSYSKNSLVLQTIWEAGKEFKNDFKQDMLRPAKSGEVRFFSSYNLNENLMKLWFSSLAK